ncbi:hypothetical protein BH11PLA2_BH11PLA2_29340 [soil metagenome]
MIRTLLAITLGIANSSSLLAQAKGPNLPEGATLTKDIVYGDHVRNKFDLYQPKSEKPVPLVIWIHGGAWTGGDKASGLGIARLLLPKGYAVASVNYRFFQHDVFPAQIHDVKAALRQLRADAKKYNLDADNFGVGGDSAGGHLAALVGTSAGVKDADGTLGKYKDTSTVVKAVLDYYGPTDFLKMSPPGAKEGVITKLFGGDTGVKNDLARLASPMTHVDKTDPPFLIIHGDKDPLVPLNQSEMLRDALKNVKVNCDLIAVKGGGHGSGGTGLKDHEKAIVAFFEKNLKAQ